MQIYNHHLLFVVLNLTRANYANAFSLHTTTCSSRANNASSNERRRILTKCHATIPSHQGGSVPSLPNVKAAVIVPGFLTGKDEFIPLAQSLTSKGIPTVVVPMPNWHWLPCLGGRSMRPMLERIDFTVRHLAAVAGDLDEFETITKQDSSSSNNNNNNNKSDELILPKDPQLLIPNFKYNLIDLYQDFRNNPGGVLQVGGSAEVDEYPLWNPKGTFQEAPEPMGKVEPTSPNRYDLCFTI